MRVKQILRVLIVTLLTVTSAVALSGTASAIVGGHEATLLHGAVSMWSPNPHRSRCTGELIAPDWVLSAAHCTVVQQPGQTSIRVGLDNTSRYFEAGLDAVYVDPSFDPTHLVNDLALYQLHTSVPLAVAHPLVLSATPVAVGALGITAGYGLTCQETPAPPCGTSDPRHLQELDVQVIDDARCVTEFSAVAQVCYRSASGKAAMSCFGDSGSPIVTPGVGGSEVLRGVVTFDGDDPSGARCEFAPDGSQGLGVAVDVAPQLSWIINTMILHGGLSPQVVS